MVLSAKARRAIPASQFVYPPGSKIGGKRGKYPINTKARARNALSRAAQKKTAGSYATVKAKVSRRYPSIGKTSTKRKTTKRRTTARRRRR